MSLPTLIGARLEPFCGCAPSLTVPSPGSIRGSRGREGWGSPVSVLVFALVGALLSACGAADVFGGPGPFVREGNANSVEIGFSGDPAIAMPLARKHCAQFERVPRYLMPTLDGGIFECVRPNAGL